MTLAMSTGWCIYCSYPVWCPAVWWDGGSWEDCSHKGGGQGGVMPVADVWRGGEEHREE